MSILLLISKLWNTAPVLRGIRQKLAFQAVQQALQALPGNGRNLDGMRPGLGKLLLLQGRQRIALVQDQDAGNFRQFKVFQHGFHRFHLLDQILAAGIRHMNEQISPLPAPPGWP